MTDLCPPAAEDAPSLGALTLPGGEIARICAARDAALARAEDAARFLSEGYAAAREAAELANGAHHGARVALCHHEESPHYTNARIA